MTTSAQEERTGMPTPNDSFTRLREALAPFAAISGVAVPRRPLPPDQDRLWSYYDSRNDIQYEITRAHVDAALAALNGVPAVISNKEITQPASDAAQSWQPIETAPQDGSEFLGFCGGIDGLSGIQIVRWNDRVGCWETDTTSLEDWDNQAEGYSRPTHWMPLPSQPSTEVEQH